MSQFQLRIHFDGLIADLANADIIIHIEDVSEADAPARELARHNRRLSVVRHNDPVVVLELERPVAAPGSQVAVRIHVDRDGDGAISVGDFINTTACPLRSGSSGGVTDVFVQPI